DAVVLLSGGLDSATVLAIALDEGFSCSCLSFKYGQRQERELQQAKIICERMGAQRHLILRLELAAIGGSALTADIDVPKNRGIEDMQKAIPITYVPGRNIIFLAHAIAWGEVIGASDIFLGINAIDYSGYPDCRPDFLDAFATMANLGTRAGCENKTFTFHAPLMHMGKKEIIKRGIELGVDYAQTHSCYDPQGDLACGRCDACRIRLQGFSEAGIADPVQYVQANGSTPEE
ncbi:MAG: 7-cyano-7-deazaguanine synthase QueC, partial [Desulfobulbales bacterium]